MVTEWPENGAMENETPQCTWGGDPCKLKDRGSQFNLQGRQKLKMVFTNQQQTAFFENNDQMGLANRTRVFLQSKGIAHPRDLIDFVKKEAWDQLQENCKRPPQVPDPNNAAALINQPAFRLPSKSLLRLKVAARAVEYYKRTGRELSAANMAWV